MFQVNESEREKLRNAAEHRKKSAAYSKAESRVREMEKTLKRSINKSRQVADAVAGKGETWSVALEACACRKRGKRPERKLGALERAGEQVS